MLQRLPLLFLLAAPLVAQATTPDDDGLRRLVRGTHDRLVFDKDIERIAVGDPELMSIESITTREVLLRGVDIGRTSVVIWFDDETTDATQWVIQPDLRVLQRALADIDPSIVANIAPDRDAVVLRGETSDIALALQAESITRDYLQVGAREEERDPRIQALMTLIESDRGEAFPAEEGEDELTETVGSISKRKGSGGGKESAVINLIRYPTPSSTPLEDRVETAISSVAGAGVVVRRVPVGSGTDDAKDVFLLEGAVPDQIALTRVIHLAASVLDPGGALAIEVVADESGALAGQQGTNNRQGGSQGGSFTNSALGGNSNSLQGLQNRISANVGRATVLSAAGGRVLSFLEVRDLPQVRVEVQLYEVNRTLLRSRGLDVVALGANFDEPSLSPSGLAGTVQGAPSPIAEDDAQGVAGWLQGALTGQFQINAGRFAADAVFQYLENEGVARSLSRPKMTVLSGEVAMFQVGGEVPIRTTTGGLGTGTGVVFNSVQFRPFGIQLAIRPLVGRSGFLTLDVQPQIVTPDANLTASIADSSGGGLPTTAFRSRVLQTTARLRDGQVMLLGGLVSRNDNESSSNLPGLSDLPLLGWIFEQESRSSDDLELVIVVSPLVLREQRYETDLWETPSQMTGVFDAFAAR